jgi:hypothetical protein
MHFDTNLTIQALLTGAQVLIAIIVGYVALLARRDAKRNSVAGLLKHVSDLRDKMSEDYANRLVQVLSPNLAQEPEEIKRILLDQLDDIYHEKRGLDIAYGKLVTEADAAWGLGKALERSMSGMNPNIDADWEKMRSELRNTHLGEST